MNTLSYKVYARFHVLIIYIFEFACTVDEKTVSPKEVTAGNRVALKDPDTSHKFAEI